MDVIYVLDGLVFEWDTAKAEENLLRHGVSFRDAAESVVDPHGCSKFRMSAEKPRTCWSVSAFGCGCSSWCILNAECAAESSQPAVRRPMNDDNTNTETERDRPAEELVVRLPARAMRMLERVAAHRSTTCHLLAREYIGRGIREDEMRRFDETVLLITEDVLKRRIGNDEEVEAALAEVRAAFRPPPIQ